MKLESIHSDFEACSNDRFYMTVSSCLNSSYNSTITKYTQFHNAPIFACMLIFLWRSIRVLMSDTYSQIFVSFTSVGSLVLVYDFDVLLKLYFRSWCCKNLSRCLSNDLMLDATSADTVFSGKLFHILACKGLPGVRSYWEKQAMVYSNAVFTAHILASRNRTIRQLLTWSLPR